MKDHLQRNIWLHSGRLDTEKHYWLSQGRGASGFTLVPTDRPHEKLGKIELVRLEKELPQEVSHKLLSIAAHSEYAMFVLLLSGVQTLLFHYAGSADTLVGMPLFPNKLDLSEAVLNTIVPLRTAIVPSRSWKEQLAYVKATVSEAGAHQNYPIDVLAEELGWETDANGFPVVHTMVSYHALHEAGMLTDISFQLHFEFAKRNGGISIQLLYNGLAYEHSTMDKLVERLCTFYQLALLNPDDPLECLPLLTEAELSYLRERASVASSYGVNTVIHSSQRRQHSGSAHPLMHRIVEKSSTRCVYESEITGELVKELNKCNSSGITVLKESSFIDMAICASHEWMGHHAVQLNEVQVIAPLLIESGETIRVRSTVEKEGSMLRFRVESLSMAQLTWMLHAECTVTATQLQPQKIDLGGLLNKFHFDSHESRTAISGMESPYSQWQIVQSRDCQQEMVFRAQIHDQFIEGLSAKAVYSSLLDCIYSSIYAGQEAHVLRYCSQMVVIAPLPRTVYVRLEQMERSNAEYGLSDSTSHSIVIYSDEGQEIARLESVALYGVRNWDEAIQVWCGKHSAVHQVVWSPIEEHRCSVEPEQGGFVLLLREREGLGHEMSELYRQNGWAIVDVFPGERFENIGEGQYTIGGSEEDYVQLFAALDTSRLTQVIHMFGASKYESIHSVVDLQRVQLRGVWSLFCLARALGAYKLVEPADIYLITCNAYEVTGNEPELRPEQAPLLGLGKVISAEYPQLRCHGLDIDGSTSAHRLMSLIMKVELPLLSALREDKLYAEIMKPMLPQIGLEKEQLLPGVVQGGTYIITGGTGGIGIEMARFLTSRHPVHLVLISRSGLPDRSLWEDISSKEDSKLAVKIAALREMELGGSTIVSYAADISDETRMAAIVAEVKKRFGAVNGIIHAAGVAGNSLLSRRDPEAFADVLRPKVEGTFVLDQVTKEETLDFFLLFSSIATLGGAAGQGDYTAANSYLDAYGAHRCRQGKHTVVLNWAGWKETGMAVDYHTKETFFKGLSTQQAIEALSEAIAGKETRRVIGQLNLGHSCFHELDRLPIRFSDELLDQIRLAAPFIPQISEEIPAVASLRGLHYASDAATYAEERIAHIICDVLGLSNISVEDDFFDLGGHSILAIKLVVELEKAGFPAENIDIYEVSTVKAIAKYMERARESVHE